MHVDVTQQCVLKKSPWWTFEPKWQEVMLADVEAQAESDGLRDWAAQVDQETKAKTQWQPRWCQGTGFHNGLSEDRGEAGGMEEARWCRRSQSPWQRLTKVGLMEPEGQRSQVELRGQGGAEGLEGTGRAKVESPCHGRAGHLKPQDESGLHEGRTKGLKGASEGQGQRNGWLWCSRQERKVRCEHQYHQTSVGLGDRLGVKLDQWPSRQLCAGWEQWRWRTDCAAWDFQSQKRFMSGN